MDTVLGTLRQTRDELIERSNKLAGVTRDRGLEALGKVRDGALDWRRTLAARRASLGEEPGGWFRFAGLQLRVLDGVDRALAQFTVRMRAEMKRLRRLELPRTTQAEVAATEAVAAEAVATDAPSAPPPKASRAKKKARKKAAGQTSVAPKRLVLPIADYGSLTVKQIVAELPRLSEAQCKVVLEHERAHKKRKTVLHALETRLTS